jgi:hypothetical protein
MLPAHWKASIDFLDFVHMGLMGLMDRMKVFDPKKGAASTLAYSILDSCYKGFLERISYKKRTAELVDYEKVAYGVPDYRAKESLDVMLEAEISVQKLHRQASFELLCLLDDAFFHQEGTFPRIHSTKFQALRKEFQSLAKDCGVGIDAYRMSIALHHARAMSIEHS